MRTLSIRRGNFHGVAYSADGRFLVSLNSHTQVRFWELAGFTQRLALKLPREARSPFHTFCLRSDRLLVGGSLWDVSRAWAWLRQPGADPPPSGEALYTPLPLEGGTGRLHPALAVTPDGGVVGFVTYDVWSGRTSLCVWDGGGCLRRQLDHGDWPPVGLAVTPDGRSLALARSRVAVLLDLESGKEIAHLEHTDSPGVLAFSPDGRLLAVGAGRKVWLWDVADRNELARFPAFRCFAESLAFSPDGRLLAAGSRDGQLRLWETDSRKEVACLDWKVGAVHGLAFSPDGMTVAAAGHDNALVVWDVE
jgi:WD40 repeat protein